MNAPKKKSIGRHSMAYEIMDVDEAAAGRNDNTPCLLVMEVPPSVDEELKNFHETLFGVMENNNIQPKMISRSEVLSVHKSTADIYVLPIFEGPEFEHLISKGCKVIGPFVVDRCMKMETRLPKWTHPIYSLSMEGAVVCFSGFKKKNKSELTELVMRMGGIVSTDLHDKVTVLIAKNCDTDSAKYTESAKLKLPILREDWITDTWSGIIDRLADDPATTNEVYDAYRVPLFVGMVITVSGLSMGDRSNAGRLIEMGRGEFTPEMRKNKCTHLITDKNSGDKFKKAREWGLRIVTLKWLVKSVEMGYIQKESHYDPERVRASTPTKNGAKPPEDLEFSMVAPPPNHGFNHSLISSGLNSSVNMTVRTLNEISVVKPSFIRSDSSRRMSSMDVTVEETRVVDATKDIDMTLMNGDEDFFEGLRIFLMGMNDSREIWWKKFLNWSGATRANKPENATHIVVVGGVDKTIPTCGKPLLSTEWVTECIKRKRLMPHTDFIFSSTSSTGLNQSLITSVNGPLKKTPSKASQTIRTKPPSQQVLADLPISTQPTATTQPTQSIIHSTSLRRSVNPIPSSSVGTAKVFKGVTFKISEAILGNEGKDLLAMIVEAGGKIVPSNSPAHYLVCTLLDYGLITTPSAHQTQDIISVFWVYRCIDSSSLVSPSGHPLFRPLPACRESMVFEGLVVSLIAFDYEQEKFAYEALLAQYGATICPAGGRKMSRGVTHTIAGGLSKDAGRMSLVGQKPLDPSWIIECIVHNKILLEDNYHFKTTAYSSYEGRKDDLWEWERIEERREESREVISRQANRTTVLKENAMEVEDSNAILDMDAFDGGDNANDERMDRTEAMEMADNGEEDSMVREITDEMEIEDMNRGGTPRRDNLSSNILSSSMSSRTPKGRSQIVSGSVHHPRLKVLRSVATPSSSTSSPSDRPSPHLTSPSLFLHPNARPKLVIPGLEECIEEMSSPAFSDVDRSIDQLSASGVGRMLDGMVMTTGRMNDMMETPIRGTSLLEDGEDRDGREEMEMNERPSIRVKKNILDRIERREVRKGEIREEGKVDRRDASMDYGSSRGDSRDTMEVDYDSPRDSIVVLAPEVERRRKEVAQQIAATLAMSRKKEEEGKVSTSSGTTASEEKGEKGTSQRKGEDGQIGVTGGGRSRRKRLNLAEIGGSEAKRAPVVVTPTEDKPPPQYVQEEHAIGWADTPLEFDKNDGNPDHSRFLDSPIKIRRDPSMPSTSTMKSSVVDRSMTIKVGNRSLAGADRPLVTPAKTLRTRVGPPMDDKTQDIGRNDEIMGEKSTKKAKSTATISRRGRGKENGEKAKVFTFTSLDNEMKDRLIESVRALGGSISHLEGFDPTITHVICGKIIRNEKNLGAMASGAFILKPSFLIESEKAKKWIKEDEHEWINNMKDVKGDKDIRMVEAIARWKRIIEEQKSTLLIEGKEGKVGSFISWRVVIYAASRSIGEPLMRLVKGGGGEAMLKDDVQMDEIEAMRPTHILVDGSMMEANAIWNVEELRFLHSLGARVFAKEFLYKYLILERIDETQHYLPEYKKLLACE